MHQLVVLNHIGLRTDWIVQRNHLLHRTPVFCCESHTHDSMPNLLYVPRPPQQSPHLRLYCNSWTVTSTSYENNQKPPRFQSCCCIISLAQGTNDANKMGQAFVW